MRYINPLLFLLLVIVGIKLSDSAYRWVRFGPERAQVKAMRVRLVDAGARIVTTRREIDSLQALLHASDDSLQAEETALRRYGDGPLPPAVYERYRMDFTRYNAHIAARNETFVRWQDVVGRYHGAVSTYTLLSDSVHDLAARMGDPYYAVPTPAEAAIERGLLRVQPER